MNIQVWSNPKYTNNTSVPLNINFEPGITMLIGTNGCGKSTMLRQIDSIFNNSGWNKLDYNDTIRDKYLCYHYDNCHEEQYTKQVWLESSDSDVSKRLMSTFANSEGQDMWDYLYYQLGDIGRLVRRAKQNNKSGAILLFDGLDSGLSLDKLYKLKTDLFEFIIKEDASDDFEIYIICSSNSYEFVKGYNCLDVVKNANITFSNYAEYEQYFLKEVL